MLAKPDMTPSTTVAAFHFIAGRSMWIPRGALNLETLLDRHGSAAGGAPRFRPNRRLDLRHPFLAGDIAPQPCLGDRFGLRAHGQPLDTQAVGGALIGAAAALQLLGSDWRD